MEKQDIMLYSLDELKEYLNSIGEKPFRAKQIYEWLHQKLVECFDDMTNISNNLKEKLNNDFYIQSLEMVQVLTSKIDGTQKFLFRLNDGNVIESVLMRYKHGNSVCISTQVGCRMGCRFCASTLDGLVRNLKPSEMLEEIYYIQRYSKERVSNIVLMGSGEPMDNFDNVLAFVKTISDENGLHISQRNITISSCGLAEKIKELADSNVQVTLALSLHAADDETRKQLMPIAYKYSIREVLEACQYFFDKTGRRITFEYSLVAGVNDTKEEAAKLVHLIKGMNCHVNLIPVNPIKERDFKRSTKVNIASFKGHLEKNGINATVRREMGSDIQGACGQLRKSFIEEEAGEKEVLS
ncbi:23S rRNA (adenine(2503)-C(2))-methyltransferase RlmN [Bovifimicola ammoniilytica]|uniref:23S rRNA (adenine(2503)-C(2))-methyltransferase RlmN n=1 Tax=Bovifimicola ammoniilytica TaxID=2981720 RepID=UPI0008222620|nr:23S rRNA (adenine(2503)-C(2))-methyltransferase RlmN [Bovifimicola ammoniilytica]MCU6754003.1 23S rRNA (adenine(2503)-C(2))-methyltransferase RlmN [Bovifimicola ammoniilytica]SCJ77808.1 Ribosomal RNA large subunit methyltransferase N [uncultured Eubacterium sp.]